MTPANQRSVSLQHRQQFVCPDSLQVDGLGAVMCRGRLRQQVLRHMTSLVRNLTGSKDMMCTVVGHT